MDLKPSKPYKYQENNRRLNIFHMLRALLPYLLKGYKYALPVLLLLLCTTVLYKYTTYLLVIIIIRMRLRQK